MEGQEVEQDVIQREIHKQGNLTEKQLPNEQILDKQLEKSHNQPQNEIPSVDRLEEEQPTGESLEKQELNYQKEGNIQQDYNTTKELNEENNNKINKQKEHSTDEKQNEITQNKENPEMNYEASLEENNQQENLIGGNDEENITKQLDKEEKENSLQKDKIPSDKNLEKEKEKLVDKDIQNQRKEKHLIVEENTNKVGPETIQHSATDNQQKQVSLTEKEFLAAEKEKMKEKNKQKVDDVNTFKELEKQKEKQSTPKLTGEQLKELHTLIEKYPFLRNKTLNEIRGYVKIKLEEDNDYQNISTNKKEIGSGSKQKG
ncbi:unnamed protein product [Meloidogyne enterolobii]|uniref:Uncharacterized protein n=1 Tax=Meloidogyne enterolobii TaxID=390850 RepID=A0ACB0XWD5_MELEN